MPEKEKIEKGKTEIPTSDHTPTSKTNLDQIPPDAKMITKDPEKIAAILDAVIELTKQVGILVKVNKDAIEHGKRLYNAGRFGGQK